MGTIIQAPHPNLQAQIQLPNPELGNRYEMVSDVTLYHMADETYRTIVRGGTNKIYSYAFRLTSYKAKELALFVEKYSADKWKVTSVDGTIYVYITNEVDFRNARKAVIADSKEETIINMVLRSG